MILITPTTKQIIIINNFNLNENSLIRFKRFKTKIQIISIF